MKKKIVIVLLTIMMTALTFTKSFSFSVKADNDACEYSQTQGKVEYQKCLQNRYEEIEKELDNLEKSYDEAVELVKTLTEDINELQSEIDELQPRIEELSGRIEELEVSIAENELKVEELKQRVLTRMKTAQGKMHFNPMLDFILGSDGFSDMLRRTYGIEAITQKEEKDRNDFIEIINKLNADRAECEAAKEELDIKMMELESNQNILVSKKAAQQRMIAEIDAEIEKLREESSSVLLDISNIDFNLEELIELGSQNGMIAMVRGATISAGMPSYPASFGGGMHIGVDYAASYGTAILAPANGVIVSSVSVCEKDTGNNYGSRCGYVEGKGMAAGGNQLRMIMSVNGYMFGLIGFHMQYGSPAGEGVVTQGSVIGRVGSSGNSTGAHCHIELFYLGEGENEDIAKYLAKGYTVGFNLGYNTSSLCYNKRSAPCRLDGRFYFGRNDIELTYNLAY